MSINKKFYNIASLIFFISASLNTSALAGEVNLVQDLTHITVEQNGKEVRVERIQDQTNHLTGIFAKTSRKCPPFCIQPITVTPNINTVGELEVIQFIEKQVKTKQGILIDARTASWYSKGTIPGSINVPFTTFTLNRNSKRLISAMKTFGVIRRDKPLSGLWITLKDSLGLEKKPNEFWDFHLAKDLLLWCNGMWCGQSPRAIKSLIQLGYPAEKLYYFRNGMQGWKILGLTVSIPK